jgi:septal ring factor EnvC (AmiA/AmiB activator)
VIALLVVGLLFIIVLFRAIQPKHDPEAEQKADAVRKRDTSHDSETERKVEAVRSLEKLLADVRTDLRGVGDELSRLEAEEKRLMKIWNGPLLAADRAALDKKIKQLKKTKKELEEKRNKLTSRETDLSAKLDLEAARKAGR